MFKKEYLILFAVIIGACLYLFLKDRDRVHYRLPEPALLEKADIVAIEIRRPQPETITMKKVDGRWRIDPSGYAVDEAQVKKMVEAVAYITLTALVSESGDYDRYELADDSAIQVTARSDDSTVLRELKVGKRASSGNHTFVRIGEDPFVYHAGGSLHDIFDKAQDDLREKTVLSFDKAEIDGIAIATPGETLQLEKRATPTAVEEDDAEATGEDVEPDESTATWMVTDGRAIDQSSIESLLETLSSLECERYLPNGTEKALTDPDYKITLSGKKDYTLSLFTMAGDEEQAGYAGISSANQSPFFLSEYQAGRIMKKPFDLLTSAGD